MIKTLKEFVIEMTNISKKGWIKTHRSGSTGVGKTLEDLLGINENNNSEPDFGLYELKASRDSDTSMLTLFTKAPQPKKINSILHEKYGYISDNYNNTTKVLHATLSANIPTKISDTGNTLRVLCSNEKIVLLGNEKFEEAYWDKEELKKAFYNKYKHTLIYVKAKNRNSGTNEEFFYYEAYELSEFNYEELINLLEEGIVKIDIRIGQYKDGRIHDHGTAFRIQPQYFHRLFKKQIKIWKSNNN